MNALVNKLTNSKVFKNYLLRLKSYKHCYNSRNDLATLDDNMLKDIGITRAEAKEEAAKPFWQSNDNYLIENKINTKQTKRLNIFNKIRP